MLTWSPNLGVEPLALRSARRDQLRLQGALLRARALRYRSEPMHCELECPPSHLLEGYLQR